MPYFNSPVDSARLFYRHYEPDESGYKARNDLRLNMTLVFLHGWPMSSEMYSHLMVPLCETYRFRCIAPDRRGFGKSDWNSGRRPNSISWQTFVDDTMALLEQLDIGSFILAGASMGAPEALMVYLQSPFVKARCKVSSVEAVRIGEPEQRLTPTRASFSWARPCPILSR